MVSRNIFLYIISVVPDLEVCEWQALEAMRLIVSYLMQVSFNITCDHTWERNYGFNSTSKSPLTYSSLLAPQKLQIHTESELCRIQLDLHSIYIQNRLVIPWIKIKSGKYYTHTEVAGTTQLIQLSFYHSLFTLKYTSAE
jgi:hypothetical protein